MPLAVPLMVIIANILGYTGVYVLIATMIVSAVVSNQQRIQAARRARDSYNSSLKDRLIMTSTTDGPRGRIYGQVRNCDGVLFKTTHGTNKKYYTLVVALAGHEVDSIGDVYFADDKVTLGGSNNEWVQTAPYFIGHTVSAEDTASVTNGAGTKTLAHTPIAGSVAVTYVTYVGTQTDFANLYTAMEFHIDGDAVHITGPAGITGSVYITYQYSSGVSYARVRKYLGTAAQDISGDLRALGTDVQALIASGVHKFSGIALLLVTLEYNTDAFPAGLPAISAVVKGAKVYDPRGGATAWSDNPALCALDWARYAHGGNLNISETHLSLFTEAANACDVHETFTSIRFMLRGDLGNAVDSTEHRYRCGTVAKTDSSADDVFASLVTAMAGNYGWIGGVLAVRAGAWRTPVATITEDWISDQGSIDIIPSTSTQDTVNILKSSISDAGQNYVVTPLKDVRSDPYIAADGQELPLDIEMPAVTIDYHALDICEVMLLEGRQAMTVSLPCKFHASQLELFDIVYVTLPHYGWAAKTFEVLGWSFTITGGVQLQLKESIAATFDIATLFTLNDIADNTTLPKPWIVANVTGGTLTVGDAYYQINADGTIQYCIHVAWTLVDDAAVQNGGAIEIRYGLANAPESEWTSVEVPGTATSYDIPAVVGGGIYAVKLRARNALVRGNWTGHGYIQVTDKTTAPGNVAGLAAVNINGDLLISWTAAVDSDYLYTELRYGASWAAGTLVGRHAGVTFPWLYVTPGAYTIWAAHRDTSGNYSTAPASVTVTATARANPVNLLWGADNGLATVEPGNYGNGISGGGFLKGGSINPYNLQPGDRLTISAEVWGEADAVSGDRSVLLVLYSAESGGTWHEQAPLISKLTASGTRTQASLTLPIATEMYNVGVSLFHQGTNPTNLGHCYATNIQVERGSEATPYTPGFQPGATYGADWLQVTSRPALYRVAARGNSATGYPIEAGLYNGETGATIYGSWSMYTVAKIQRSTGTVIEVGAYNTLSGSPSGVAQAGYMATALNAIGNDYIVVIYTYDEPRANRLLGSPSLAAAMYRCGASKAVFGSPQFQYRGAYILVGIAGCGEGNGYEAYQGSVSADTNAWCDVSFYVYNGQLVISGTTATPRTLADYSYSGDLDATNGATFGTNISGTAQTSDIAEEAATEALLATGGQLVTTSGSNEATIDDVLTLSYTNSTGSSLTMQFEAAISAAYLYFGIGGPSSYGIYWEYSTSSSGSAASYFISSLVDPASNLARFNGSDISQMTLLNGDTITLKIRQACKFIGLGSITHEISSLRLTAIKR